MTDKAGAPETILPLGDPIGPLDHPPTKREVLSKISHVWEELSEAQADHRRTLHKKVAWVLLVMLMMFTAGGLGLLIHAAVWGPADSQKLAWGFMGTVSGVLWSNIKSLLESVT